MAISAAQALHDDAKGPDIGTIVHTVTGKKLRRCIVLSPCSHFQHCERIGIRESEINQLGMEAIEGHHDVLRLQIPVNHLLAVNIRKGVADSRQYPVGHFNRQSAIPFQKMTQIFTVYPLHHDAIAGRRMVDESEILADIRMLEGETYLKILAEHILVNPETAIARLQRLVDEEASGPLATVEYSETLRGIPEQFQITGDNAVILGYVSEKA